MTVARTFTPNKKHGAALSDWSDCETKRLEMNHEAKMAISRAIEDDEGMADRSHPGGYRHILTIDSESEPILTGPGNLVSFFVWGKSKLPPGGPGPTQLAPVLVRRASIVAKCAPEGVPSGHEEGEARQLKTNPFPTQSYPTKRPVQPISSNKPRDGRVGEKVCYVQCCGGHL
ncbi:hypothetical protein THAOC_12643 [Thalassiosira oceanica]|uniref:Uncharacterized protein n=1 Tax=Thalassiosira oceanica TaxID=159749 RepID=K0SN68_THAOC|nr:hypothetical protein THAOC_12643 [Thalassiosira oceanica]|eukprot:EJK66439.1 hypothetical protein THAOC_12643 [Thalassiosira oceanica]